MGHQEQHIVNMHLARVNTPTLIQVRSTKVHPESFTAESSRSSLFRTPSGQVPIKNVTFLRKLFSVRILLLGSFIFQVIFMASITIGTTTYSQKQTTTDLSNIILSNVVLRVADQTKSIFEFPWQLTQATYAHVEDTELTWKTMQLDLWRQFKLCRDKVIGLYIAFANGDAYGYYGNKYIIYVNKTENIDGYLIPVLDEKTGIGHVNDTNTQLLEKYDMRVLQWWEPISKSKTSLWSEVYLDSGFPNDLFFTSLQPIFDSNGQFVAAVGLDITSRALRDFLSTISISDNSVIWIMDPRTGALVACSNPNERTYLTERPGITYAFDSNLRTVRETSKRIMARNETIKSDQLYFSANGEDIVAHVHALNEHSLQLYVIVAYPRSDFTGSVTRLQTLILAVSAVAFVVSLIVGIWVMFLVTSPLAKLGKQMDYISNGNFENHSLTKAPSSTKLYEIHSLQLEFQRMVTALRSFGRFVPVDIVRHLLRNNTEAVASVSQKELTVMFSDIKGFTRKVEEMSPQQLSLLLSDYLSAMCAIIGENDGTVDKFIGDAIMALWNVPTPVKHHPIKACTTALQSVKALRELNVKWVSNGLPDIQCRIGIHTGRALVGNLGSNERLSYTAVGDSVNLASRLEALNKRYETSILISGEVYEQVKHVFLCRYLDIVVVQGRTHATSLYELVDERDKASQRDIEIAQLQKEAVVAFFEKRFGDALQHLIVLREMIPHDVSVISLSERATEAFKNIDSLPHDWTGYYVLNEK